MIKLWLVLSVSLSVFAAKVIEVSPDNLVFKTSHEDFENWTVDQPLCVFDEEMKHAKVCGKVMEVTKEFATVKVVDSDLYVSNRTLTSTQDGSEVTELNFERSSIEVGDRVIYPGRSRTLTSLLEKGETAAETPWTILNVGINYILPMIDFQLAFSPHFASGLMPMYISYPIAGGSMSGFGGYWTFNYYPTEMFRGLFYLVGIGAWSITAKDSNMAKDSGGMFAFVTNIGWRWRWDDQKMNFGLGFGVHYLQPSSVPNVAVVLPTLVPSIAADLGWAF